MASDTLIHEERASTARPARWPAYAGTAFAVLFVAGMMLSGNTPEYDASDEEWVDWFDDSGNRLSSVIGMFAMTAAGLAFLGFLAGLLRRVRAATGPDAPVAWLVAGAGVAFAVFVMIAGVAINQVAAAIEFGGDYPTPGADVLRQSEQLGFGLSTLTAGWAALVCIGATSLVARRTGFLPRWLAVAGLVASVLLVVSVFFIPMIVVPLWVLAVSIVWLRKPAAVR